MHLVFCGKICIENKNSNSLKLNLRFAHSKALS